VKVLPALTTLLGAAIIAGVAGLARADTGYFNGDLGPRASGRGGAFVARADDVTAVSYNPAGLAKIRGTVFEIGNQFSYNAYDYMRAPTLDYGQSGTAPPLVTFQTVSNGSAWQAADPLLGVVSDLGLPNWGFALAAFAPPGISREQYPLGPGAGFDEGGQRYMMVSREAIIIDYAASAAWKHGDTFGLGATLQWITMPRLVYSLVINGSRAPGAFNPVSSQYDLLATTTGSAWFTFNAIVGAWFRPVPSVELALSGQVIPTSMVTNSTLSIAAQNPSVVGDVTLSRNGDAANDVNVTLPLPLIARAGGRYRGLAGGRERFDVELDLEYETWSRARSFTVDGHGLEATASNVAGVAIPVDHIDIAKQWRDTIAFKLGGDINLVPDRWTLRAGAYYETAVAPPAYANIDFPGGPRIGAALGASLFVMPRWEVMLAYQLRYQIGVTVAETDARLYQQTPASPCVAPYQDMNTCNPNFLGQSGPAVNAGHYSAASHLLTLGLVYRYGS
jgi:long-chain fatty acid transport protein